MYECVLTEYFILTDCYMSHKATRVKIKEEIILVISEVKTEQCHILVNFQSLLTQIKKIFL